MRVLIVDDDPKFRGYVAQGLAESKIDCAVAADAEAALRALEAERFELVLLDVMLPARSGWELVEELRARGDETPVIFVTARDAVDERVKGLRLGADDYIIKPFAFAELLARVEAVLRRRRASTPLSIDDLVIDRLHRRVHRGERAIELSPREFDLLCALAERPGEVLSRSALLHQVWGIDFDPGTNVVDVHIGRLRRKIDARGRPLIQTVRNQGYVLQAIAESAR